VLNQLPTLRPRDDKRVGLLFIDLEDLRPGAIVDRQAPGHLDRLMGAVSRKGSGERFSYPVPSIRT